MENLSLADLVAYIESRGSNSAIRFEPDTYNKFTTSANVSKAARVILARIQTVNKCSVHTAAMIYSSSWGKFQLMGFNVYAEPDAVLPVGEFLACQSVQVASFVGFLKRNGLADYTPESLARDQAVRLHFAITYNGAIGYADLIVGALKYFGMTAK